MQSTELADLMIRGYRGRWTRIGRGAVRPDQDMPSELSERIGL